LWCKGIIDDGSVIVDPCQVEEQEEHSKKLRVLIAELKENGKGLTNEVLYPPLYTIKTGYFLDGLVDEVSTYQ